MKFRSAANRMGFKNKLRFKLSKFKFSVVARAKLYEKLYQFTDRGIPMTGALKMLHDRAEKGKTSSYPILRDLLSGVRAGESLGDMVSTWVPASEAVLIKSGEETGKLPDAFKLAAFVARAAGDIKSSLIKELTMPLIVVLAGLVMLVSVSFFVLPLLAQIEPDPSKWPFITNLLAIVARIVIASWWIFGILFAVGVGAIVYTLPTWTGKLRLWLDKRIFPWTLYRVYNGGGTMIALSAMTQQAVPFTKSIPLLGEVASPWLRWHLRKIESNLQQAMKTGEAMDTGLFEAELAADLRDYDEAQALVKVMPKLGEDAINNVRESVQSIAALARILGIMFALGLILFIYGAIAMLVIGLATVTSTGV